MTSILVTAVTYFVFFQFNDWLFSSFELHSGANWIYLPAGLRLLCTLLLGIEGAIGIFIAALAISLQLGAHRFHDHACVIRYFCGHALSSLSNCLTFWNAAITRKSFSKNSFRTYFFICAIKFCISFTVVPTSRCVA